MIKYVRCSEIIDVRDGTHDSPKYINEGGYPLITSKNIKDNKIDFENVNYISNEDYIKINERSEVVSGDIIMPMIGTIGNPVLVNTNKKFAIKNVALFKLHNNEKVNSKFFYYVLKSENIINQLNKNKRGGTQSFVSLSNIRNLEIPILDITKQIKIVEVLDKAQELIDKRKEQIEALDELVKSKFIEMFGDVISNKNNYSIKRLEEITSIITDGTHQTPTYADKGYIFLSSKNVTSGKINWVDVKYIPEELHIQLNKRLEPKLNDILLAKNGTTGVAALVDRDCIFDIYVSLALIRLHKKINPVFMLYMINSDGSRYQFNSSLKGIGVPNLHLSEIRKTKVLMPPIGLQNQFADFVKQVDKLKLEMEKSLKELEDNFNSLIQKAFKGELFN